MCETVYFVYLLTFPNGKVYVGMSKTDKRGLFTLRYNNHANSAKNGNPLPVYHAWRKYGAPTFAVLSTHAVRQDCALAEINKIAALNATDPQVGYNLMPGGEGRAVLCKRDFDSFRLVRCKGFWHLICS